MFGRIATLALVVLLGGCQTSQVNHDFDASRDFGAYRSWAWKDPALQYRPDDPRIKSDLTEQRIRQAVGEQLDQRGLRPAAAGTRATSTEPPRYWIRASASVTVARRPSTVID